MADRFPGLTDITRTVVRATPRHLLSLILALGLLAGLVAPVVAQDATPGATPVAGTPAAGITGLGGASISAAAAAVQVVQDSSGGFIGFSGEPDPGTTTDAVFALVAAEGAGVDVGNSIDSALDYLETAGADYAATGVGQQAKLVLAVEAGGDDASDFGGTDLWSPIEDTDYEDGAVGQGAFDLSLVVLAAVAMGSDRTTEFADLLVADQLEDGAWSFTYGSAAGEGDTNTTALAIQAIVASGDVEDPAIGAGLDYLGTVRAEAGGYAYQPNADGTAVTPDANSTALVIQAMIAAGAPANDPDLAADAAALAAFQNDSGQFRYMDSMPEDNLFATVQALPAIASQPLPLSA